MPNHVTNKLQIYGPQESIDDFMGQLKQDDEGDLELIESLYPTPEDADFHPWRQENWGSVWGDYDTEITKEDNTLVARFMSAWTPPLEAFQHISTMFPDLTFEGSYDEPMNAYLGAYAFRNGQQVGAFHVEGDDYPKFDWDGNDQQALEAWGEKVNRLREIGENTVHKTVKLFASEMDNQ